MTQGFYTGITGLTAYQTAIDVTADNIANVNTVGFRSTVAEFGDLLEEKIVSGSNTGPTDNQVGIGTRINATTMNTAQGIFERTNKATDLAIAGEGWFGIQDPVGTYFTRAGDFIFDGSRNMVTNDGMSVLGTVGNNFTLDGEGNWAISELKNSTAFTEPGAQVPLNFPKDMSVPPQATSYGEFFGNIGFPPTDVPASQVVRTVGSTIVDGEGNENGLFLTFTLSDTQPATGISWNVNAKIVPQGADKDSGIVYDTQDAVLLFDETGGLTENPLRDMDNNGVNTVVDIGQGLVGIRSTGPETSLSSKSDGIVGGDLVGYAVADDGNMMASFSNGVTTSVGRLAVYHFQNEQGLERVGASKYQRSSDSGDAVFWKDASGEYMTGTHIYNNKLETSNVNLTESMTNLIIMQKAYSANSKLITTGDEMIKKALEMKR
ncbi:MAG: flagellar hook-basal body complex protein [Helicobacteraceae bacterium]|nr:flagellar hook-basal body complex protein [Helicobacteraceae bacterium]